MSNSQVALLVMAALVSGFGIATLFAEFLPVIRETWPRPRLIQTGDSSLSRRSVNWLAAAAVVGAVVLGAVLV